MGKTMVFIEGRTIEYIGFGYMTQPRNGSAWVDLDLVRLVGNWKRTAASCIL